MVVSGGGREVGSVEEWAAIPRERSGRKKEATVQRERGEEETGSKLTAVGEGRQWWWGHVTWHVPPA
jgi:hypothetical protein